MREQLALGGRRSRTSAPTARHRACGAPRTDREWRDATTAVAVGVRARRRRARARPLPGAHAPGRAWRARSRRADPRGTISGSGERGAERPADRRQRRHRGHRDRGRPAGLRSAMVVFAFGVSLDTRLRAGSWRLSLRALAAVVLQAERLGFAGSSHRQPWPRRRCGRRSAGSSRPAPRLAGDLRPAKLLRPGRRAPASLGPQVPGLGPFERDQLAGVRRLTPTPYLRPAHGPGAGCGTGQSRGWRGNPDWR